VVLDPCAGTGEIIRALKDDVDHIGGIEIDPGRAEQCRKLCVCDTADALKTVWIRAMDPGWYEPTVIIMNPPFQDAIPFIRRALVEVDKSVGQVAALMRLGMMAGQERAEFWAKNPADVYVLSKRPNFTEYLV
jgi:predicted RNA methylase